MSFKQFKKNVLKKLKSKFVIDKLDALHLLKQNINSADFAITNLVKIVQNSKEDSLVRVNALEILDYFKQSSSEAQSAVELALEDPNQGVRNKAQRIMSGTGKDIITDRRIPEIEPISEESNDYLKDPEKMQEMFQNVIDRSDFRRMHEAGLLIFEGDEEEIEEQFQQLEQSKSKDVEWIKELEINLKSYDIKLEERNNILEYFPELTEDMDRTLFSFKLPIPDVLNSPLLENLRKTLDFDHGTKLTFSRLDIGQQHFLSLGRSQLIKLTEKVQFQGNLRSIALINTYQNIPVTEIFLFTKNKEGEVKGLLFFIIKNTTRLGALMKIDEPYVLLEVFEIKQLYLYGCLNLQNQPSLGPDYLFEMLDEWRHEDVEKGIILTNPPYELVEENGSTFIAKEGLFQKSQHNQFYRDAIDLFKQYKCSEALESINNSIDRDPDNLLAYYVRSMINLALLNYDDSLEDMRIVLEQLVVIPEFYLQEATVLAQCSKKDFEDYVVKLKKAFNNTFWYKFPPEFHQHWIYLDICYELGEFQRADEIIQFVEKNTDYAHSLNAFRVLFELERDTFAEQTAESLYDILAEDITKSTIPDFHAIYTLSKLSLILGYEENIGKNLSNFADKLQNPLLYFGSAETYLVSKYEDLNLARQMIEKALELAPYNLRYNFLANEIYYKIDDIENFGENSLKILEMAQIWLEHMEDGIRFEEIINLISEKTDLLKEKLGEDLNNYPGLVELISKLSEQD